MAPALPQLRTLAVEPRMFLAEPRTRGPARLAPQGLAQLAREGLDGAAGAAREPVLPLALGLEAAVLQTVAPRLDRLADGVEVERVALELAGARHHVGSHPDEGAQRGAGLDRVLATRPRGGEHPRHRL